MRYNVASFVRCIIAGLLLSAISLTFANLSWATPPITSPGTPDAGASGDGSAGIGVPKPWVGSLAGVNLGTGNKLTTVPIIGWKARGGMAVSFGLFHNSYSDPEPASDGSAMAAKWTYSYASTLTTDSTGSSPILHWDDGSEEGYTHNANGSYSAQVGNHSTLIRNSSPDSYDYTTTSQIRYRFSRVGSEYLYQLSTITDLNGNSITVNWIGGNVSSIVDPTGRTITLGWNNNELVSISALGKQWTLQYGSYNVNETTYDPDSGRNVTDVITYPVLNSITFPTVSGVAAGTTFTEQFLYFHITSVDPRNFNITVITNPRGYSTSFDYNPDGSLAIITNALSQVLHVSYQQGSGTGNGQTTLTDPNQHSLLQNYVANLLTYETDSLQNSVHYGYDSGNNVNDVQDALGQHYHSVYDSQGNQTSATDPDSHTSTVNYNALNDSGSQ